MRSEHAAGRGRALHAAGTATEKTATDAQSIPFVLQVLRVLEYSRPKRSEYLEYEQC